MPCPQTEPIVDVCAISKRFRLYKKTNDRIREALHPLRKRYHAEHWALRNVSLQVYAGEAVGILGRNGSGKSTLLALIAGILRPDGGSVRSVGRMATLLQLGAGFRMDLTGRDNVILQGILLGMQRREILKRLPEIQAFAEIGEYFDQPMRTYSSGMFLRVAYSAAVVAEPDILLVDEALAVGDAYFQGKCFKRFREFRERGASLLFVSHDMQQISKVCCRVIVLSGGAKIYDGPTPIGINVYQASLHGEIRAPLVAGYSADDGRSPLARLLDRSDSSERLSLHPGLHASHQRFGDGRARLLDIVLVSAGEENPRSITSGAHVDIYLKYEILRDIQSPAYGIGIVLPDGTLVYGTNTAMKNVMLPAVCAGSVQIVRFHFRASLRPGTYFMNAGINDAALGADGFVDILRSIVRLDIEGLADFDGACDLGVGFELV